MIIPLVSHSQKIKTLKAVDPSLVQVSEWKYEVITVQRAIVVKDIDPLEKSKTSADP
jgi:hypothetical protein